MCEWLIGWLLEKGGDDVADLVDPDEIPKSAGHQGLASEMKFWLLHLQS